MSQQSTLLTFYRTHRRMPTYRELMPLFGYHTKSAVAYAIQKLIDGGVISKDRQGKLIPNTVLEVVRLLGVVEAGFPSPAEEELADTMNLDEYLIDNREATFMLKVKGDSMIDAGINEGDMVLVERGLEPKTGDIVIAEVDGAFTMKYYRKKAGRVYLEAANKNYRHIYPKEELRIAAIVKAVIRKY